MAATDLRIGSIRVHTTRLNESRRHVPLAAPVAVLNAFTEGGAVRNMELSRTALISLIAEAAAALQRLDNG